MLAGLRSGVPPKPSPAGKVHRKRPQSAGPGGYGAILEFPFSAPQSQPQPEQLQVPKRTSSPYRSHKPVDSTHKVASAASLKVSRERKWKEEFAEQATSTAPDDCAADPAAEAMTDTRKRHSRPHTPFPTAHELVDVPYRRGPPQACPVCRLEPLVFQECPDCNARYCARGCLDSWYERSRNKQERPLKVPVVEANADHVFVRMNPDSREDSCDSSNDETDASRTQNVELALSRLAGGGLIGDPVPGNGKHRWSIISVDGWELGQPGPGPNWQPAPGSELVLQELGRCRACEKPLALGEYISNSACKDRRFAIPRRNAFAAVQKPRVKMIDSSTQTTLEFTDAGSQAVQATTETEVQVLPLRPVYVSAQATIVGISLASLIDTSRWGDNPALVADATTAKCCIRDALASLACVAAEVRDAPSGDGQVVSENAVNAVESFCANVPPPTQSPDQSADGEEAVPGSPSAEGTLGDGAQNACDLDDERILGHRRRVALPNSIVNDDESDEGTDLKFDAASFTVLGEEALSALKRASNEIPPPRASMDDVKPTEAVDKVYAEARLLKTAVAGASATVPPDPASQAVCDAVVNLAAALCGEFSTDESISNKAVDALGFLSRLIPKPAAEPAHWRRIASNELWSSDSGVRAPRGWAFLQQAIAAVKNLADAPPVVREDTGRLVEAFRSIARLALFLDKEAEEAEAKAREEEELRKKKEEIRKKAEENAVANNTQMQSHSVANVGAFGQEAMNMGMVGCIGVGTGLSLQMGMPMGTEPGAFMGGNMGMDCAGGFGSMGVGMGIGGAFDGAGLVGDCLGGGGMGGCCSEGALGRGCCSGGADNMAGGVGGGDLHNQMADLFKKNKKR